MNLPCEIIRDLLPLYQDRVCSAESKTAVEVHLPDCPACTATLEEIQAELHTTPAIPDEEVNAKVAMGALAKRWRRSKLMTAVIGVLIAIGLTLLLARMYHELFEVDNTPAAASQVEVVYLYRAPNDFLNICMRYVDGKRAQGIEVREVFLEDEQGIRSCYVTLYRPKIIIGSTPNAIAGEFGMGGFTDADTNVRLYYGTPEDNFLIWEPGMELPVMTEQEAADHLANAAQE